MISVGEAARLVNEYWPRAKQIDCDLEASSAVRLAADIRADRAYPPIDRVMMDGIAVSFDAWANGARDFRVRGIAAAGSAAQSLLVNTDCLEVMTGAPLPAGASLVIPYEHLRMEEGRAVVALEQERRPFENVHRAGSDCAEGEVLLQTGQEMNGPRWGIAASVGASRVKAERRPRVRILSTGDELVSVAERPLPHQLRRSNGHALRASLLSRGFTDVALDHVRDDYEFLLGHYEESAAAAEVLIYSGGVSKGKFDFLPRVWEKQGVRRIFHEVRQRPGKPLYFGVDEKRSTVVVGLPGNPVSSLVCLHRYFLDEPVRYARLTRPVAFDKPLTYFAPVRVRYGEDGVTYAEPAEVKNSGEFTGLAESDGFVELSSGPFAEGSSHPLYLWGRA